MRKQTDHSETNTQKDKLMNDVLIILAQISYRIARINYYNE